MVSASQLQAVGFDESAISRRLKHFLDLFRHNRLPPEVNVKFGRWAVDFPWRAQRLVVEADCWTYHRGSVAFEDDHARDLAGRGSLGV